MVEGVHLSLNAVMRLMAKHDAIVPFLIHIRCLSAAVYCIRSELSLLGAYSHQSRCNSLCMLPPSRNVPYRVS